MRIFTPDQMNHQDIDAGFLEHRSHTTSSSSFLDPSSQSDSLIIILLVVLLLMDTPLSPLAPLK